MKYIRLLWLGTKLAVLYIKGWPRDILIWHTSRKLFRAWRKDLITYYAGKLEPGDNGTPEQHRERLVKTFSAPMCREYLPRFDYENERARRAAFD